ncbi:unnamed protein product [Ectocarpus sp. CCAP 1310/34]|nr:unnamed protein product [Ectocarpus sp. CCAP 1310/34]
MSFDFLQMNDHCDINKLVRLEAHLNGTSCGVESPLRRDAKVNLLKFLQTGAVKSFERSYDDMVFELDKTGGLSCLRNIVPVPPDGALSQKNGFDLQGLLAEASRSKTRLDDLVKEIVEECDGGCRYQEASVKSPESSQRKADKSYNGDVRRLTDMARVSVICDTPEDLERTYIGIKNNFEVQVIHIESHPSSSMASATNYLKQGYVPFSGKPEDFHGWSGLFYSIMDEQGLGDIMAGTETAPASAASSADSDRAAFDRTTLEFKRKNGKLYTRLNFATSDCADGFSSTASQVVRAFGPARVGEHGDGRAAYVALEAKYRQKGTYRMHELQRELGSLAVTAEDDYDPARAIQDLRRISSELESLGDKVVPARQTHILLNALPDQHYAQLKAALVCGQADGSELDLDFENVAHRATAYHTLQIRGKVSAHGRAHNTVVHGGARSFRKQGGRGGRGGRNRQGNGSQPTGDNGSSGSSAGNSRGDSPGGAQDVRGRGRGNKSNKGGNKSHQKGRDRQGRCKYCHNSTEHGWDGCPLRLENVREDNAQQANAAAPEPSTQAWFTRVEESSGEPEDFSISFGEPQALEMPAAALPEKRAAVGVQEGLVIYDPQALEMPAAALPEERAAAEEEVPEAPVAALPEECAADDAQVLDAPAVALPDERAAAEKQVAEAPAAALPEERAADDEQVLDTPAVPLPEERAADAASDVQVQNPLADATDIVAYTSVYQVKDESARSTIMFVDTAASSHMVSADSYASRHVTEKSDCNVRIKGSCGTSSAAQKGILRFGISNDRNQLVPVELQVLLVDNLGANILSVGALKERGVMCDLLSTPPALRSSDQAFPISTEISRMYSVNIVLDDMRMDGTAMLLKTKVNAHMWHRRMGHCNPRALQQLARKEHSGVKFDQNIESGDCEVCAVGNSKKSSHPPANRPRAGTRLALLHVDTWSHSVKSLGGHKGAVMFTCDNTRMRFGFPIKSKDAAAEALETVVKEEADPEGLCITTLHCDGGGEFKGRFAALAASLGIKIETNAPYMPQGNAVAERGFGTVAAITRRLLLGAPHLPESLWAEAFQYAIYILNRTPTDVLGGKAPLEVWENKPLGSLHHIREFGSVCFKHVEAGDRPNKLAARAEKMFLVGVNPKSRSWRLWSPRDKFKITNSAEVSIREKAPRDVVPPKAGHDPLPETPMIYHPGPEESDDDVDSVVEPQDEQKDNEPEPTPQAQEPGPRRSTRNPKPTERLNLFTFATEEEAFEQVERSLLTGSSLGNNGTGNPGEVGYRAPDPSSYDEAIRGQDALDWQESMRNENQSLVDLDVYDWVEPPTSAQDQPIPSRYLYKRKYKNGELARLKSRVVVQGFHQADTGEDKAAPVASMESVHLLIAIAAKNGFGLKQADIKTAFLHARVPANAKPIYVIPPKGFECSPEQQGKVWRLKAWLYGLRLSPKGWNGTFHDFLLEIGFVQSTADPCLYILNAGGVLLLVYVDDILLSGSDEAQVMRVVEQLKERFDTVFLGDAQFLLGMALERNVDAGTIFLSQEMYAKAVLDKFGMADAHSTKTPAEAGPISTVEEKVLSPEDTVYFRSATGSLLYLSRGSRPDITHSVMVLTKSMAKPGPKAMAKLKRVLRYLKGTTTIGITYTEDADGGDKLTAYADSDFAGDQDKGYSTTGVVLYLAGGPVIWIAKNQTVLAISTFEAEVVALSKACLMVIHFRNLLESLKMKQKQATVLYEDNAGAVAFAKGSKITPRTKHIDVKFHHVRHLEDQNVVDVTYIDTNRQRADILTKSSGAVKFLQNRLILLGV